MSRCELDSKIASVTVYENRAQVHRSAETTLAAGSMTLVFTDIPAGIDRDSVQVSLKPQKADVDAGACVLNGITYEKRPPPAEESKTDGDAAAEAEEKKTYESELKRLQELKEDNTREMDELSAEGAMYQTMFAGSTNPDREGDAMALFGDVEHWERLVKSKIEYDATALDRKRELTERGKSIQKDIDELNKGHREKRAGPKPKKRLTSPLMLVHLEAKVDIGPLSILVSYMVKNASWRAAYDLRVDTKKNTAALTYHALVQQSSTDEWTDVSLTLSTAKPTVSGRAPDLSRWYASVRAPPAHGGYGSKSRKGGPMMKSKPMMRQQQQQQAYAVMDAMDEVLEDDDSMDELEEEVVDQVAFEQAEVVEGAGSALSFEAPHAHTVPSTNDPVRVPLTVIQLTPEISYATRPSMAELAYAILSSTNTSTFAIMPGDANVFVDGQFVTKTALNRIAPKATIRIGIGHESTIDVKYKAIKEENSEVSGVLSGRKKKREYFRQIALKNHRDTAVKIRVEHEVPTAEDQRIDVQLVEPSQSASNGMELKDGKLILPIELPARGEAKVPLRILVTYPADLNVEGL